MKTGLLVTLFFLLLIIHFSQSYSSPSAHAVITVEVKGTITRATAEAVKDAVAEGRRVGAEALIILLDTQGGQLDATMKIAEYIEGSQVPVITYVYPKGAKAWSAGTLILISSHIAAMAPHTVIGSAQPVSYLPLQGSEPITDKKILNALSTYMAERARMYGRNETAARLFVEENLNLNSEDALRFKVIEMVAINIRQLLNEIDGYTVQLREGESVLRTRGANVKEYSTNLRIQILKAVSDPILAYLLFIIGIYALIFGLASPGYGGEVLGGTALLIGLIGLGFDLNLGAVLIIGFGSLLLITEAYTPGFGILGGAGLFCIIIGSILAVPLSPSRWLVSAQLYSYFLWLASGIAAIAGCFTIFMIYKIFQARKRKPVIDDLIGSEVIVIDEISREKTGFVRYRGEYWRARANEEIKAGQRAIVISKDGPILVVKPSGEE